MVDVDVVVPSWAATIEAQAARMLKRLVNCILMVDIGYLNMLQMH
jgi:hypothetical protein